MWIIIGIVVAVIIFVLWGIGSSSESKSRTQTHTQSRSYPLQECISSEDTRYIIDEACRKLERQVEQSRSIISEAKRRGYITVSTAWTERFTQMMEISNTLNQNLIHENQRRLQDSRFHRYTDLHFRSFIMGRLAYEDYMEAKAGRDQIGNMLVAIGKKQVSVSPEEKQKLYQIKDAFKESTALLYDRMISIERETARLRDKIGSECGKRGKEWWEKIMKGRT